jgi:hypothetical protein
MGARRWGGRSLLEWGSIPSLVRFQVQSIWEMSAY